MFFLKYDRYNPKTEQRINTCPPAPPKAAAFDNTPVTEPASKCIKAMVKILQPRKKSIIAYYFIFR